MRKLLPRLINTRWELFSPPRSRGGAGVVAAPRHPTTPTPWGCGSSRTRRPASLRERFKSPSGTAVLSGQHRQNLLQARRRRELGLRQVRRRTKGVSRCGPRFDQGMQRNGNSYENGTTWTRANGQVYRRAMQLSPRRQEARGARLSRISLFGAQPDLETGCPIRDGPAGRSAPAPRASTHPRREIARRRNRRLQKSEVDDAGSPSSVPNASMLRPRSSRRR